MSDVAIRIENLGKMYRIGGPQERYRTLRDSLIDTVSAPFKRAQSLLRGQAYGAAGLHEEIWALKDVSFEVKHGEVVGIIGRNGAGKSTLLKVLSRITEPTKGVVDIFGRVGALLEVGTGFHTELTGRENIYLNGAILGMSREEIDRKFDEIVDFSGVERFIDTPVKHYSSGMGLRLGFAVAAHLEPEILIVDEVLAVGDAQFQKKCLGKMSDVASEGRTVLFVSHNMSAVEHLCPCTIWLDSGTVRDKGPSYAIVTDYLTSSMQGTLITDLGNDAFRITQVVLKDSDDNSTLTFPLGSDIAVDVRYVAHEPVSNAEFWIAIDSKFGPVCGANMMLDGQMIDLPAGEGTLRCRFKALPLLPQSYSIRMGAKKNHGGAILFKRQEIAAFKVMGDLFAAGLHGERASMLAQNSVPLMCPYEWSLPNGQRVEIQIVSSRQANEEEKLKSV